MGTEISEHNECVAFLYSFHAGSFDAGCWKTSIIMWIGRTANYQMRCAGCASLFVRPRVSFTALNHALEY
jgi:hypothetical protein